MQELRFAVRCHGSAKKPKLRRQCSQCSGGLDAGAASPGSSVHAGAVAAAVHGEPSPNGVLLGSAQSTGAVPAPRRPSGADDRLHYRRSARVDCDYAVDRRRTSMRSVPDVDYADRRPSSGTDRTPPPAGRLRDPVVDSLARSFAKV